MPRVRMLKIYPTFLVCCFFVFNIIESHAEQGEIKASSLLLDCRVIGKTNPTLLRYFVPPIAGREVIVISFNLG